MFKNEVLRKSTQQAANFKMPYLVPQSSSCNYCLLLKKYPNLVGTHVDECQSVNGRQSKNSKYTWRGPRLINGELMWVK